MRVSKFIKDIHIIELNSVSSAGLTYSFIPQEVCIKIDISMSKKLYYVDNLLSNFDNLLNVFSGKLFLPLSSKKKVFKENQVTYAEASLMYNTEKYQFVLPLRLVYFYGADDSANEIVDLFIEYLFKRMKDILKYDPRTEFEKKIQEMVISVKLNDYMFRKTIKDSNVYELDFLS